MMKTSSSPVINHIKLWAALGLIILVWVFGSGTSIWPRLINTSVALGVIIKELKQLYEAKSLKEHI